MPLARWAFNIRQPLMLENVAPVVTSLTADDIGHQAIVPVTNLLHYLPRSEADALLQLRPDDDMKRALIGRLMIHAFFTAHHNCDWKDVVFEKSQGPKPVLLSPEHVKDVTFNISHHGDWVMLVGETEASPNGPVRLGVDVVDFHGRTSGDSFEIFDQFTAKEMTFMGEASSSSAAGSPESVMENRQRRFFRLWCLKESILKALNVKEKVDPKSFEITIRDVEETEKPILSTVIEVHEPKPELIPPEGWSFEEALLDSWHCYAIAAQSMVQNSILDGTEIRRFDWKELLKDAVPYQAVQS
ncbi:hypothetical protein B0O80DRAFT_96920 [Mortierella sp. GBAus27b]|nr:hypothetical protein BGX31_000603 [Mortierella sp. GBA43]KAI8362273.1 hypothetical protein B0O80DRAFT_96920 [Mortierella sp. GBAus27b]